MKKLFFSLTRTLPDYIYLKIMFFYHFKYFPDLKNPKTFNEKLQWLKLHDRNPQYTKMVDKIAVKEYVANKIGVQYVIPILQVWSSAEEITVDNLPERFVIKCNHDSKSVFICDKSTIDLEKIKRKISISLKRNGFWYGREWPYKNVPPKVFAETYVEENEEQTLTDYKVVCFNGKAHYIQVHQGRGTEDYTQDFYTRDWKKTDIKQGPSTSEITIPKPDILDEMLMLSEFLAQDIPTVRIDWYYVKHQLLFGEITFFDGSGFIEFDDPNDDLKLGEMIDLKDAYNAR